MRLRRGARAALTFGASAKARLKTELAWRGRPRRRAPHGLAARLIVSLTSHPPRFGTLAPTLKCLLSQSVAPDLVVLWLGEGDAERLPPAVLALRERGLTIRSTADIGPFTKIIPALRAHPGDFIVTADDDVYYGPRWLERLVAAYDPAAPAIVCQRAHRVRLDAAGRPISYANWVWQVPAPETSPDLFPTGVGGVLYFPGALPELTLDQDAFLSLSPRNDDIWLYWMERLAGLNITTLGQDSPVVNWPSSQRAGLRMVNTTGALNNDVYVRRLFDAYGLSFDLKRRAA